MASAIEKVILAMQHAILSCQDWSTCNVIFKFGPVTVPGIRFANDTELDIKRESNRFQIYLLIEMNE